MKTIRVVAAIIKENNHIFATARGYGDYKGMWEFPGGKIEPGETPQEALQREIHEELTADIAVGDLIYTIEYDYPTFHLSMDCFWCTIASGELKLLEAEAGKWLSKEDLYSVNWLPADLQLIEQIQNQWDVQMLSGSQKTLDYYNQNAVSFVKGTVGVEFTTIQDKFRALLPEGSCILDFGCGSGRDTKFFLEHGYQVDATDGSEELCRMASEYTGICAKQMLFQELDEHDKYDGIWACSSMD